MYANSLKWAPLDCMPIELAISLYPERWWRALFPCRWSPREFCHWVWWLPKLELSCCLPVVTGEPSWNHREESWELTRGLGPKGGSSGFASNRRELYERSQKTLSKGRRKGAFFCSSLCTWKNNSFTLTSIKTKAHRLCRDYIGQAWP